ncbi:MAG: hypothetical protein LDL55_12235, partial [Armatimonadetes bacterium]|nr:hypothetical protein [Armatimonadota bacterium]
AHDLKRVYKVPKDDSSSYSSVHVIIEAECGADGNRVSAHCEIQLRSVFEEAWSEINHRLVYAPTKRGKALDPDAMQTAFAAGPAEWQHHLDALKSLTDGCAQYADLIRRPFLEQLAEPRERPPQSSEKFAEIAPAFRGCGEQVRKAVDKAFKLRDSADSRPPGKDGKGDQFAEAAKAFADALDALEADQACSERVELRHLLLEERAYCLLYSGNAELKGQAEQIFLDLVTTGTGSYKTYLRYAQIKRDAGEFDEARTLLMEALQRARTTPGSENSMFVITRNLGYVCWKISNLATALDDRKALLSEAISHTREALTFASPTRRANGLNNLLYYLWELADLTDESEELAEQIRRTLTEFKAALVPEKATLRELDTLMRVEHCYGDKTEAGAIAHKLSSRLRKKMDAQGSAPSPRTTGRLERLKSLTPDEQDMYLYAQEVLTEETSVG